MNIIKLKAEITVYGTKSKRAAIDCLRVMLNDYDDNNRSQEDYKEITIRLED